jgi:hypothetical protein
MVQPLYTAPFLELSTTNCALCGSTPGFHPEMVPSSVTKINNPGLPAATAKSVVPLKTMPLGVAVSVLPFGGGTVTTNGVAGCGFPFASYRVEVPVPLFDTHQGLPLLRAKPQGFLRLGSVTGAMPSMSETRLVWL